MSIYSIFARVHNNLRIYFSILVTEECREGKKIQNTKSEKKENGEEKKEDDNDDDDDGEEEE